MHFETGRFGWIRTIDPAVIGRALYRAELQSELLVDELELRDRIELPTSPLPWVCSAD